jgi:hypothetical protein
MNKLWKRPAAHHWFSASPAVPGVHTRCRTPWGTAGVWQRGALAGGHGPPADDRSWCGRVGSVRSHSSTVLSVLTVAMVCPSAANAIPVHRTDVTR